MSNVDEVLPLLADDNAQTRRGALAWLCKHADDNPTTSCGVV